MMNTNITDLTVIREQALKISVLRSRVIELEQQYNHLHKALEAIRTRAADEVNYDCDEFAEAIFDMANGVLEKSNENHN